MLLAPAALYRLVISFPDALDDFARDGNKQRLAAELLIVSPGVV